MQPEAVPLSTATFGRYHLIATLGAGGMADVYLAVVKGPAGFSKLQVIKRLRWSMSGDESESMSMFLEEARLAARLNHPNVVQTNEVGEANGEYFIAMEYLDGQSLSRIIQRARSQAHAPADRERTDALLLHVLADALAGLHHVHELVDYNGTPLHVVHRDISPHNIFVTYEGQTKVVDFGIAKAATRSIHTKVGVLKGKLAYMAPEQVLCKPVDRRTDLFIIGVALWEIVAGKKMWKGLADMEIFNLILSGYVPRLADEHPDTPPMLIQICERALAIEPDDRYQTAAELRGDLLAYLERAGRRFTNEDIGQLVGELFADERLALKAVIDRQLNLLGDREAPTLVDARNHVGPATSTSPDGGISQPLSTLSIIAGDKSAIGRRTTAKAELRRMLLTAGLSAIVASIFALVFVKGSSTTTETVPQAPVTAAPPATAQEPTQEPTLMPRVIELRIVARPSSAQLFLDDIRLEKNPFVGKFPADGARHLVRVMAPGYTQQKTFAEFSGDVVLEFDLEKKTIVQRRPKGKATVGAQP